MTAIRSIESSFAEALHGDAPDPARAEKLALYGRFVGAWDTEVVAHGRQGETHEARGEIHFGWVLEGRAIQDVWMIPQRAARGPDAPILPIVGNWYGTTLCVYEPRLDAWHIFWIDPATGFFSRQLGRAHGDEIVQEGRRDDGVALRWRFTEIEPASFHWLAEVATGEGGWQRQVDVFARRRSGGSSGGMSG